MMSGPNERVTQNLFAVGSLSTGADVAIPQTSHITLFEASKGSLVLSALFAGHITSNELAMHVDWRL